jgi:hypothetical protein
MIDATKSCWSILGVVTFGLLALGSSDSKPKLDLKTAAADGPSAAELAPIFEMGGKATDLQRDEKEKAIEGKIVDWRGLKVYEVAKSGEKCFRIQTSSTNSAPGTFTKVCPDDDATKSTITGLKTDDIINVKGVIDGVSFRNIELDPAILVLEGASAGPGAPAAARDNPGACGSFPSESLVGRWTTKLGADMLTMALESDGSFAATTGGNTVRGTWKLASGAITWTYASGGSPPETNPLTECSKERFGVREKDGTTTTYIAASGGSAAPGEAK